jgi:hypothetical protein
MAKTELDENEDELYETLKNIFSDWVKQDRLVAVQNDHLKDQLVKDKLVNLTEPTKLLLKTINDELVNDSDVSVEKTKKYTRS